MSIRSSSALASALVLVASVPAHADRGSLSVDGGGGMTGLLLPAPFAAAPNTTAGTAPAATVGARYALSNRLELSFVAFYEIPVTYFHNNTVTVTSTGSFPGTLLHTLTRFGGRIGARLVHGMVFRWIVGAEAGWSHRVYEKFTAIADADPAHPTNYNLALPDQTRDNLSLAAVLGVEWTPADHWSVSLLPRLEILAGRDAAFAVTVPLTVSFSWYL